MSDAFPVQDWLREGGARSLHVVRSHIAAETTTDTDAICATVSKDVFFAVPVRTRAGHELGPGTVLTSWEQVYDYYAGRADSYVVLASTQLASTATGWYVFNESAASLRATGRIGSADVSGREFVVNSAILFPTAPDGIRGEICITRHPFEDVATGRVPAAPTTPAGDRLAGEIAMARLQDALLASLREGGGAALAAQLAPGHTLAVRLDDVAGRASIEQARGAGESLPAFARLLAGSRDVALVTRLAGPWYLFSELLMPLAQGRRRRLALLHAVEDGRITGSFGYGREEDPPG